jgi:hypothetical protein
MTDKMWVEVNALITQVLTEREILSDPPRSEIEVGYLADAITDNLVSAFTVTPRR